MCALVCVSVHVCVCACVCVFVCVCECVCVLLVAIGRNRPHAGRTGTRGGLGGRPQPRWQEGVALAKQVLNVSADDSENNSFLNVGSQIQGIRNSLNSILTFNTFFGRRSSPGVT